MRSLPDPRHEAPVARRPHHIAPSLASVRAVLVVHRWLKNAPGSDAGLSVTINSTMRVLRRAGIHCSCTTVRCVEDIFDYLEREEHADRPVTHVVINTYGFVSARDLAVLAERFPETEFAALNHSGQSFLEIDPPAIENIRLAIKLQRSVHNIRVAGNNRTFLGFIRNCYGAAAVLLPNLYDVTGFRVNPAHRSNPDPLRVGTFGATRPAKNQFVAEQAALGMARRLGVHLEWHVSGQRFDSLPRAIASRRQFLQGHPSATLVEHPWKVWHDFLDVVEDMDILLMPSFDETHCMVVCDAISCGVPCVTTEVMNWTPPHWWAKPHDPSSVMRVGLALLHDRAGAVHDGREALTEFVAHGTQCWINYLTQ